jgi:HEPN domain-containing protein
MIDEYVNKWLIKALEDFKTAKHELDLSEDETVTSAVCFHSQQCVEKLLKAYLVYGEKEFGRTHDLVFLLSLCAQEDSDFNNITVNSLNFYAVDIRYPDDFYIPTIDEAKDCFEIAKTIKVTVLQKLNVSEVDIKSGS